MNAYRTAVLDVSHSSISDLYKRHHIEYHDIYSVFIIPVYCNLKTKFRLNPFVNPE